MGDYRCPIFGGRERQSERANQGKVSIVRRARILFVPVLQRLLEGIQLLSNGAHLKYCALI